MGLRDFVLLTKYYSDSEIKEDVMGRVCGTCEKKINTHFNGENLRLLGRRRCRLWDNIEVNLK